MFVTPAFAQETPAEGQLHTETGVAHNEPASGVFPPFDTSTYASQLLWLVLTFGVFYMLMQKVIVPRVGGILENRHDRIAQDLDEASRLKAEADAAIETYERAQKIGDELAEAKRLREEAQHVLAEYQRKRKEAEAEAAGIIAAAEREAAALTAEAKQKTEEFVARRNALSEQKIKQAESEAVNAVRAAAVDLAVAAAEKVLTKKADEAVQQKLFSSSVGEVKARLN